jgi:hypothetical protein
VSRPSFCPHCGAALSPEERSAVPIYDPATGDGGYDCYCDTCGWSGDVYPDDEQGIEETEPTRTS